MVTVRVNGDRRLKPIKLFGQYLSLHILGGQKNEHRIYEIPEELVVEAKRQRAEVITEEEVWERKTLKSNR